MKLKEKITITIPVKKPRNPLATSPLLKKGGAHHKAKSADRQKSKKQITAVIDEFYQQDKDEH